MMAGKAKSTLGPQNKPREVPKIAPERVILTSNCNMSNAKKTENTNTEQIMLYVAGVQKRVSVHLALFMTTRYNSSNSATGNESTDVHMSSSSARAGFREATGIRRAPPRGETRRSESDLAWSRLGLNWTEGAEGTEGPILRDRRSLIWAPENHNLRQEASRAANYST